MQLVCAEYVHHKYSTSDDEFWISVVIACGLTLVSAFCSGATQGMLSIDLMNLEVKLNHGTTEEKQQANVILPVIEQHHLLLSTLLICNAMAIETLPIILHQIAPDWLAVLISSCIILLFGEIIPSAFTTGPDQLLIATKMIPYVKVLQALCYIVSYPLSLFLDWLLGTHHKFRYQIKDIRGLLNLHAKDAQAQLSTDQMKIMSSMMELREQHVSKQSIDINSVFMVSAQDKLNSDMMRRIRIKGYSRIPIYDNQKDKIVGIFNVKSLLKVTKQDYDRSISQVVPIQEPLIVSKDTTLLEMLAIFQDKRKNIAFISDTVRDKSDYNLDSSNTSALVLKGNKNVITSMICLTDLFEEMLDIELDDEDVHGTLKDHPRQKHKFMELGVIREEPQETLEKGLEAKLLPKP